MGLWTPEHAKTLLPAIALMILLGVVLRKCLGASKDQTRMIPLQILACVLVLLEIGKQVVSLSRGYDLYHLPFHICSLFIFLLPIMAFYRGRYRKQINAITTAFCASVFLLMLIYPNLIYSAWNIQHFFTDYLSFHTVAFHNIVIFSFVLILALQLHRWEKNIRKAIVVFTVCFCLVSSVMAQVLKTNYANFYTCNIPVFENLRLMVREILGGIVTQILYILIVSTLTILFVLMSYGFFHMTQWILFRNKKEERQNSNV